MSSLAPSTCRHDHPGGQRLSEFLDGLEVERFWLKGYHVIWQTGQKNGEAGVTNESHTHCSAFAAAVAMRLDIYVLRPPSHAQLYLASAQHHWLLGHRRYPKPTAAASGWKSLGSSGDPGALASAVRAANVGRLVLASFAQRPAVGPDGKEMPRPGHVAIIRPTTPSGTRPVEDWQERTSPGTEDDIGPQVCSAGHVNANSIAMRDVFAPHPGAWPGGVMLFARRSPLEQDILSGERTGPRDEPPS